MAGIEVAYALWGACVGAGALLGCAVALFNSWGV